MQLIPVIDIYNGVAVHAKLGQRAQYQPINSKLCASCKVSEVIEAFLTIAAFQKIYIADLNALTAQGNNAELIQTLVLAFPQINFWVDAGYQEYPSALTQLGNYTTVLASEAYPNSKLSVLQNFSKDFVLSLDFSAQDKPLGSLELFQQSKFWPSQIIIMTLARVGSEAGLDVDKLSYYQSLNTKTDFIAAGGIRNIQDLQQLKTMGIQQALCASALHNKILQAADLQNL